MAMPSEKTHKFVSLMVQHLLAFGTGTTYGPCESFGLERDPNVDIKNPRDSRLKFLHYYSDASTTHPSVTGGVGMLAHGPVQTISQRQHLSAPCAHTAEVVAAGTNYSYLVPTMGVLQELSIQRGASVPFYLDSLSTVFVCTSDTAIKKSAWLIRRVAVLEDGVKEGEIEPIHISEKIMLADPFTKYLTQAVWVEHMLVLRNKS